MTVLRTTTAPRVTRVSVPLQLSDTTQRVPRTVAWLFLPWVGIAAVGRDPISAADPVPQRSQSAEHCALGQYGPRG